MTGAAAVLPAAEAAGARFRPADGRRVRLTAREASAAVVAEPRLQSEHGGAALAEREWAPPGGHETPSGRSVGHSLRRTRHPPNGPWTVAELRA